MKSRDLSPNHNIDLQNTTEQFGNGAKRVSTAETALTGITANNASETALEVLPAMH